jgi:response regulator RpfG family c-di-GMP phosphodiesterase
LSSTSVQVSFSLAQRDWSEVKVLLIKDDRKIAAAVRRGLEAEGFGVDISADGAEGEWLATEGSFDLIVLDIMLPSRNGYQVCANLRQAGVWTPGCHLPVVARRPLTEPCGAHRSADAWLNRDPVTCWVG